MGLSLFDLFDLSYRSVIGNPLRSALTAVGVFMGVAAVNATLQVGNISRAIIAEQLSQRESPHVSIFPRRNRNRNTRLALGVAEMEYLARHLRGFHAITTSDWVGTHTVLYRDRELKAGMQTVAPYFFETVGAQIERGRAFLPEDFDEYRPAAIIDEDLAEQLFDDRDPLGERIYAEGRPYFIVGIVESNLGSNDPPPDIDGRLLVPVTIYRAMMGRGDTGPIMIRPSKLEDIEAIGERAMALLKERFPDDSFRSRSNVDDILVQQQSLRTLSRSLLAVGAISLLVGGVGIANITIASVTERTPEIGLRLAIGAKGRDVLLQFLLEATSLSLIGGIAAIATVHGITLVVADLFTLPYAFDVGAAAISLGSAVAVGVGAGFVPAWQASQLDPVKALRSA